MYNGCDKFFFFSGENPVKKRMCTKRAEKSVNFPRDWLVTRFFMAFHRGKIGVSICFILFFFCLLAHVISSSWFILNVQFCSAVFLSFYSSTTSLYELYMRKAEEDDEGEGKKHFGVVCWWFSNLPSASSEINRNAITLRYILTWNAYFSFWSCACLRAIIKPRTNTNTNTHTQSASEEKWFSVWEKSLYFSSFSPHRSKTKKKNE